MLLTLLVLSCSENENETPVIIPSAGAISGGPFTFCVDGVADMVSGITVDNTSTMGTNSTWVITDDQGNILGLPPSLEALEGVNFDDAGAGICLIWYLRYEDGLVGAEVGMNANNLQGTFDLSNSLQVTRNKTNAGVLSGGPFEFIVDGNPDMVSGISVDDTDASGTNNTWVITDEEGNILGLPPTLADVEGVNFDGAGAGVCLIWNLRYEDGLVGAEVGMNANNLEGCFSLSNAITVNRIQGANAGEIAGGPFTFCVDGTPDMVSGITIDNTNVSGENSTWVVTDVDGKILGLPPTLAAVEGINLTVQVLVFALSGICVMMELSQVQK